MLVWHTVWSTGGRTNTEGVSRCCAEEDFGAERWQIIGDWTYFH